MDDGITIEIIHKSSTEEAKRIIISEQLLYAIKMDNNEDKIIKIINAICKEVF